jgi:lipopolysaccharide export system permease protein
VVQDERDNRKPITIVAERGAFVETETGSRVFLIHGNRQQLDRATGKLTILTFEKYTLDLSDARDVTTGRVREPQERYLGELFFPAESELPVESNDKRAFRNSLRLEGHQRLVVPLTAFAFALIPLVALLCGEFNRRGQIRRVLLAVTLALLFETFDLGLRNLAVRYPVGIVLMYINALLPVAIGCLFLFDDNRRLTYRGRGLPQLAE